MVSNKPKRPLRPRREVPAQGVFGPSRLRAGLTKSSPGYTIGGPADPLVKKRIVSRRDNKIIRDIEQVTVSNEKVKGIGATDGDEDTLMLDRDDLSSHDKAVDMAYTFIPLPGRNRLAKRCRTPQLEREQRIEDLEDHVLTLAEKKGIAAAKALSFAGSGTPRHLSREEDGDGLGLDSSGLSGRNKVYLDQSSPTEQRSKRQEKPFRDWIERFRLEDEDVDFQGEVSRGKHPVFNLARQRLSTGSGSFGRDAAEMSGYGKNVDHDMIGDTFEKTSNPSSKRKTAINKSKGPSAKRTQLDPFQQYLGDEGYTDDDEEEESIICQPPTSSLIYMNKARTEHQRRNQFREDTIDEATTQLNTSTNAAKPSSTKQEPPKGHQVLFEHEEDDSDFDEADEEGFIRSPAPSPTDRPHSSSQAISELNFLVPPSQYQPPTNTNKANNTFSVPKKIVKKVRFALDTEAETPRNGNTRNEEDDFEIEVGFGTRRVRRGWFSQSFQPSNTNTSTPFSSAPLNSANKVKTNHGEPSLAVLTPQNVTIPPLSKTNLVKDENGKGETKEEAALKAGKNLLGKSGAELVAAYESSISPTKKTAVMARLRTTFGLE